MLELGTQFNTKPDKGSWMIVMCAHKQFTPNLSQMALSSSKTRVKTKTSAKDMEKTRLYNAQTRQVNAT